MIGVVFASWNAIWKYHGGKFKPLLDATLISTRVSLESCSRLRVTTNTRVIEVLACP